MKRTVLLLGSAALAVLLAAGIAVAAMVTCTGGLCQGTNKPDRITGSAQDDYIVAKRGADRVDAGAGDDVVEGNRGNDQPGRTGNPNRILEGGAGNDRVLGGQRVRASARPCTCEMRSRRSAAAGNTRPPAPQSVGRTQRWGG